MPVLLHLSPQDVTNIKDSWASVERQLIEVGVRVFICLLENQPNIKRTFRKYRSKRHSELRCVCNTIPMFCIYVQSKLKILYTLFEQCQLYYC